MPETSKRDMSVRAPAEQEVLCTRTTDPSALAKLFDEWMHGDEAEQRDTFEFLRNALDEDRPAGYKLFS
jgi:hypothetical protein